MEQALVVVVAVSCPEHPVAVEQVDVQLWDVDPPFTIGVQDVLHAEKVDVLHSDDVDEDVVDCSGSSGSSPGSGTGSSAP
jgi:hypothetical protein